MMKIKRIVLAVLFGLAVISMAYGEGIDNYTVLMLHADGSDGSTTFTDSAPSPHAITAAGDAQIDTAQSKFGGASGLFDGTGDYLSAADSNDWYFDGDFTIDCWIRPSNITTHRAIYTQREDNGKYLIFTLDATNNLEMVGYSDPSYYLTELSGASNMAVNTWYHVAAVRNGNVFTLYVNGNSVATSTQSATFVNLTGVAAVGTYLYSDSPANVMNGWIDELRISKGIARWTANFTVPSAAYDNTTYVPAGRQTYMLITR